MTDPLPVPGAPSPLVRVVDAALPRPLFERLARAVRALGTEGLRGTYRTTFWHARGAPPSALPEEAVEALRPLVPGSARLAGVEWWLSRMRTTDVQVDFHRDRDEARVARTGREVHPAVSSVLFLNRCRGGLLAITAEAPNPANPACAPDRLELDLVRPWPNRLVLFRGDLVHGVLDARGRIPAGRLRGREPPPLRLALVMNWWRRRPERVPAFAGAGRYPGLRLP